MIRKYNSKEKLTITFKHSLRAHNIFKDLVKGISLESVAIR